MKWHKIAGGQIHQETSAMEVPGGVIIRETHESHDWVESSAMALVFVPGVVIVDATYRGGDAYLEPA